MSETTIAVQEKPVLFSAPMVRAILAGTKTQTRRVVKAKYLPFIENILSGFLDGKWNQRPLPYGKPGDRLWVRETFIYTPPTYCYEASTSIPVDPGRVTYRADVTNPGYGPWTPAIHMRREYSRLTLEITEVRVERVQEISGLDCLDEGIPEQGGNSSDGEWRLTEKFRELWDSINSKRDGGKYAWEKNPWVWAISFKRVPK